MKNEVDTDILAVDIRILREDRICIWNNEDRITIGIYIENKNSLAGKEEIR